MAPTTKKKKGDLAPTSIPKVPIYKNVGNVFQSRLEDERVRKQPLWDIPRGTPATELVRARRELYEASQRLENKRTEQKVQRKNLNAQWDELQQKEDLLRHNFIRFNKFIRENQEKRDRAERKVLEERQVQEKRDGEIRDMQKKVEEMTNIKKSMEQYVEQYKMYENYLTQVVNNSSEFRTLNDILNRYEALAAARSDLAARQERDLEALESARAEMMHITEEKVVCVMAFNTKLAELQNRYERARIYALRWEGALARIKNISGSKSLNMKLVRASAWTMYKAICARKGSVPDFTQNQTEDQLMYIKSTLVDLKKIIRIAKRRAAKDAVTAPTIGLPNIDVLKIKDPQ